MPNRVLIADDHATIRWSVRCLIEKDGFTVCAEACDGAQAIEQAKQARPDIILLDLSMPNMSGAEAASALKRLMPEVPIILFTLYADSIGASSTQVLGVDKVVAKSDGLSTLLSSMRELLGLTSGADKVASGQQVIPQDSRRFATA